MTAQDEYLRELHAIVEYAKGCPRVRHEFVVEVASMSRAELQRRVICGSDWISLFHQCLDGRPDLFAIPGSGIDGCRNPDNIQAIVDKLREHCPLTFAKSSRGLAKE